VTNKVHVMTFLVVFVLAALAQAQTFTTLYNFTSGPDGYWLTAGVIRDPAGNLYGTTQEGGSSGWGTVFKLNTARTKTVLHSFTGNPDGGMPHDAPMVRDNAGNLYGTTFYGGSNSSCDRGLGCGTVFKLDTAGNETVLYSFTGGSDGCWPQQGLVRDKAGDLYGTTSSCGDYNNDGTVFKLDSAGNFTLLHSFTGGQADGASPNGGHLMMDKCGNLYGLAFYGGAYGRGVLYKLSKGGKFSVLHSFAGTIGKDGCWPYGSVVQDKAGSFYGTTGGCGSQDAGTIWKVSKNGKETILHNFAGGPSDGCSPLGGVAQDSRGNLYGATAGCGVYGNGTLYKLSACGKLTVLHSFGRGTGDSPYGEVLRTCKGTLYGTTWLGGEYGYGTVWSYVP